MAGKWDAVLKALNSTGKTLGHQHVLTSKHSPTYQQAAQALSTATTPHGQQLKSPLARILSGQTEKILSDTQKRLGKS